jgi:DNA modification methylase
MRLIHGDSLVALKQLADNSMDAIITDPPYGLSFMGKKWDYDVPSVALWKEVIRVLKPGGHALVACGTRTQHRMTVNIEDAGFEIRDVVAWIYGQGFPKSQDVSKAIDREAGAERKVIGSKLGLPGYSLAENDTEEHSRGAYGKFIDAEKECAISAPTTKDAKKWNGWGSALKPGVEYWTVCKKPLQSSSLMCYESSIGEIALCLYKSFVKIAGRNFSSNQNVSVAGVDIVRWIAENNTSTLEDLFGQMDMSPFASETISSLNIAWSWLNTLAETWIALNTSTTSTTINLTTELKILFSLEWDSILRNITRPNGNQKSGGVVSAFDVASIFNVLNLKLHDIHSHIAQENASLVRLDPRTSMELWTLCRKPLEEKTIAKNVIKHGTGALNIDATRISLKDGEENPSINRYKSTEQQGNNGWDHVSRGGRFDEATEESMNKGRWPANVVFDEESAKELDIVVGDLGSGGSKRACKATGLFGWIGSDNDRIHDMGGPSRYFYCAKASTSERAGSIHPTMKPLKLMEYLCKLITPPNGIILDPFMGSGTTGLAARNCLFDFIGVEREEEYFEIAKKRIGSDQETIFEMAKPPEFLNSLRALAMKMKKD